MKPNSTTAFTNTITNKSKKYKQIVQSNKKGDNVKRSRHCVKKPDKILVPKEPPPPLSNSEKNTR